MPASARLASTPLSILDLAHIRQGGTPAEAFRNSRLLAQRAETLNYKRFWLAEHHNIRGVACSATSVLIGYIANATSKIRVGAGGIMLPNHSPLAIAEQFGTLESLFSDRIDLGVGRAPGGDFGSSACLAWSVRYLRRGFSRASGRVAPLSRKTATLATRPRLSWRRYQRSHLSSWLQRFQCAFGRRTRFTVCVRGSFSTGTAAAGAANLPRFIPAVGGSRAAVRHGWNSGYCG